MGRLLHHRASSAAGRLPSESPAGRRLVGMQTQRIKVGTCVLLLPLHHPVHVAEDCAVIDLATKGRLVLSVGVGYQPPDFEAFEIPIAERARRTERRSKWCGWAGRENVSRSPALTSI